MDRTRTADARGAGRCRLAGLTAGLAAFTACRAITLSADRVIALEIRDAAPVVEQGDTMRLQVRALNAAGAPVPGGTFTWSVLDPDSLGFQLSTSGLVTGVRPGSGRVQASIDGLRSDPITVTVTPVPDTAAATGPLRVVVGASEAQSAGLPVTVYSRATGTPVGIAGKDVIYQVASPASGTGFFLTVSDTVPGADPRRITVRTLPGGTAIARVRRRTGQQAPDSVVVDATAVTGRRVTVPGTPVRFVVVLQ